MNRVRQRVGIGILTMTVMFLIGFYLHGVAQPLYRVQVVDLDQGLAAIDLLDQVKAQVPEAYLMQEGNTDVIQAGSFSNPEGARRRQQQLTEQGLKVQITSTGGEPIALLQPPPVSQPKREGEPFHFPYATISETLLHPISNQHQLQRDAAQAFRQMQAAAQTEGISLQPLSGYRSWQTQAYLYRRQIQRRGSEVAAQRLSAPPGYSEHHTGYAVDIGDGRSPGTHLQYRFEQTAAFQWLQTHAADYGFELSFPVGNPQGVSYEPWHWRFIQTSEARQIFATARQGNGS